MIKRQHELQAAGQFYWGKIFPMLQQLNIGGKSGAVRRSKTVLGMEFIRRKQLSKWQEEHVNIHIPIQYLFESSKENTCLSDQMWCKLIYSLSNRVVHLTFVSWPILLLLEKSNSICSDKINKMDGVAFYFSDQSKQFSATRTLK